MKRSFEAKLLYLIVFVSLFSAAYIFSRPLPLRLTLEMAASGPSTAQLFYDTGNGFNETDSVSVAVTSRTLASFQQLSFPLPPKTVRSLRFDPLTNEGRVVIRNVAIRSRNAIAQSLQASQIRPLNQITTQTARENEVEFSTAAAADDPQLSLELVKPIRPQWLSAGSQLKKWVIVNGYLALVFFLLLGAKRKIVYLGRRIHGYFESLARQFPDDSFLKMDAFAVWIYAGFATLFLSACIFNLNGSSAAEYRGYGQGARPQVLLGSPHPVRSDEWAYVTPDILNQYFRADRFALQDSVLGAHNIALTGNIPVKHVSTFFRPQFWAFFVLPADYAYSVYWQAKALLLVGGVFTFLLWVTRSSAWALTGALWYLFSPFTQWSYSWPSALPEMIGSICLATVCFCYLTTGRSFRWLLVSAVGAALFGINFAVCAYPPHLIPLAWVAAAITAAWCASQNSQIFTANNRGRRMAAISLACALLMGVGLAVYIDLKPAIAAVSETLYPGRRVLPSGTLSIWALGSHFLQWTETDDHFPALLGNICEGSGFLWLAPLTLLCVPKLSLSPFQKTAWAALWFCFLLLFFWCFFPLPAELGRITGLDRCLGSRCLPALGLANIGIVALTMVGLNRQKEGTQAEPPAPPKQLSLQTACLYAAYMLVVSALCLIFLWTVNQHLGHFFSLAEIVAAAFLLGLLGTLLVNGKGTQLALWLVISQAIAFGGVNPVELGMREFTQSDFSRFVRAHRELLQAKWLVYSDTPVRSGFIAATGCDVYTGTRYIPDIDHFAIFAARGLDLNIFNRLGYLDAHAIARSEPMRFVQISPVVVEWDVAPNDPMLRQVGIRYLAFDSKPEPKLSEDLTLLSNAPVDGFWIYQVNGS